jgi:hypothetical protein
MSFLPLIRLSLSDNDSWHNYKKKRGKEFALVDDCVPFFLRSGFPFLTEARTRSPTQAVGNLFNLDPVPVTAIIWRFLAPINE